jgi:RNA 2',3'-cyclic 3'-phosphodiesterase
MPDDDGRLFLAVPLTDGARERIVRHLAAPPMPALPGRAVPPENWHLTLRFLGDTPRALAERVATQLEGAALGPAFTLRFGRLGGFPRPARARVLWLGVEQGEDRLRDLAARVAASVERAGIPPEPRPFAPHLTLARLRDPLDLRPLLDLAPAAGVDLAVGEVVLYRSHPGSPAPRYEPLRRFPLDPA